MQFPALRDGFFAVFAIVFGITRIIIFPLWILRSVAFGVPAISIRMQGGQLFYLVLLGALQILHIFWFQTIVRMVCFAQWESVSLSQRLIGAM